jgi:hypothetical protein
MSIKSGRPFAMIYKAQRGAAGGMDLPKAKTEGDDNTFDAGGDKHFTALIDLPDSRQLFVEMNDAPGLPQMPHLYGLAKDTPTKGDKSDAGIFNSGHTAKAAFFDPQEIYSESALDGKMSALRFDSAKFVESYNTNANDISKTEVNDYMSTSRERGIDTHNLMKTISEHIVEPNVKALFTAILNRSQLNYMLHIYLLRADKHLSHEDFRGFMPALAMTYHEKLIDGANITHVMNDSKKPDNNVLAYSAANAINPLYDTDTFPVMCVEAEIRKDSLNKLGACITLYNEKTPAVKKLLYVAASTDGRRQGALEPSENPPYGWKNAVPHLKLTYRFNIISEDAVRDFYTKLGGGTKGSDFQGIDDMRGIIVKWAYRLLGKPYWKKGGREKLGFGDPRNSRFPRCILSAKGLNPDSRQAKLDVVDALKIQSNKHNYDMETCNEMIHFLNAAIYGTLTHSYCHYSNGLERDGMKKPWNLDEFVREIMVNWGSNAQKADVKVASKADHDACERRSGARAANRLILKAQQLPMPAPPRLAPSEPTPPTHEPETSSIIVTSSTTPVGPSNRSTSKSPKDFMALAMHMSECIRSSNINDVFNATPTNTEPGLAELCKDMDKILTKLKQYGVKFV